MKRKKIGIIAAGAIALAGLAGAGQVQQAQAVEKGTAHEYKAPLKTRSSRKANIVKSVGGLDLVHESGYRDFGLTPKEYELRYGHGNKGGRKSNRLRLSHNAKLKRRINKH